VISAKLVGLDEVVSRLRALPTSIDRRSALAEVAEDFSAILRAETPAGYSRKLPDSVLSEIQADSAVVGFDERVEAAGNPSLDSAARPRTRGRSVLRRWVKSEELAALTEDLFDSQSGRLVSVLERRLADGIS
jgi:adenylate kinase